MGIRSAFSRFTTFALLTIGLASATYATTAPTYDLGEPFPRATDQSLSTMWHVYVFNRRGVRYVQINDNFGHVHAAFATHDGDYLVLPIGEDTERVMVPTKATALGRSQLTCGGGCNNGIIDSESGAVRQASSNVIYQDATLQITLTENAQAQPVWTVTGQPVAQH